LKLLITNKIAMIETINGKCGTRMVWNINPPNERSKKYGTWDGQGS
jgi:hypothetical protein